MSIRTNNSINRPSESSDTLQSTSNGTTINDETLDDTEFQNELNELFRTVLGDETMGRFNRNTHAITTPGRIPIQNDTETDTSGIERRLRLRVMESLDRVLQYPNAIPVGGHSDVIPTTSNDSSHVDNHRHTSFISSGRRPPNNDNNNEDCDDTNPTSFSNDDPNLPPQ